jgi:excisionase family DNA binding protein
MTTPTLPTPTTRPLVSAAIAAAYLSIHPDDLRRLSKSGALPAYRFGTRWRYSLEELASHGRYVPAQPQALELTAERALAAPARQIQPQAAGRRKEPRARAHRSAREQLAGLDPYAHLKATG